VTAAEQLATATTMCADHTQHCTAGCPMPAVERPTARCPRGRQLATAWLGVWRRHIDAMSGRR
jgi:hypothetical protein